MGGSYWEGDLRRTKLRDALLLVALTTLPLTVAAETLRSEHDPVVKGIVAGTALFVPSMIGLTWVFCRLFLRQRAGELFLVVYMALTFLSVLAVVLVFMFDKPMAGLLGVALFGFLAYLSSWI